MENTATTSTNQNAPSTESADCERVNTILDQIIVGQKPSAEDESYFVDHAHDCSPCFDSIEKQRLFVGFLAEKVGRKGAPSALPHTILTRLQEEMA